MSRNGVGMMVFVLFLFVSEYYIDAAEVDPKAIPSPEKNITVKEQRVDEGKNSGNQIGGLKRKSREAPGKGDTKEMPGVGGGDQTVDVSKGKEETGIRSTVTKENAAHVEECDASDSCVDEKNKFVACLRVPGNDSPTLSLLIQNKGTGSLTVNILASDFVKLEQNIVQLEAEEDKKVKLSIEDGVNDTLIYLTAGDGRCNLSFWDLIPKSVTKGETSPTPAYLNLFTRSSFICVALVVMVVLLGAALLWIRFQRTHHLNGPKYQKLDAGLPVSSGGIRESDGAADGWDDSWGDSWDDEEAPKTPSKPLSNPSSKGLASRRSNKDGWKD